MKFTYLPLAIVASLIMIAQTVSADTIKISAGGPAIETILNPVKEKFQASTSHDLIIVEAGGKLGTMQLEKGEADAIVAGFDLNGLKSMIQKEKIKVADPNAFLAFPIREEKVYVAVNASNPVAKLTKDQLKGIFTEKITNWKEVGGSDSPIIVVWTKRIPGPNSVFSAQMLDNAPPPKEAMEVETLDDTKRALAATPEAIAIYPSATLIDKVKLVEAPDVIRPASLFTKGKPSQKVQQFIDFIKGEGQQLIK